MAGERPVFEPISQNLSLRDRIVQEILAKIESGELKAGDRLPPERDLALQLNVSRTTVRDALRTLAGLGVIAIYHGRGIFVQGDQGLALGNALWAPFVVKPETVTALFEVRRVIEAAAARWAAERADPRERQELAEIVASVKREAEATGEIAPESAAKADQRFHLALVLASHNPVAARLMANLLELLAVVRLKSLAIPRRAYASVLDHERVVQAVLARDPDRAEAAMRAHLSGVEASVLKALAEEGAS